MTISDNSSEGGSCPCLQTAPAWDWQGRGAQVHTHRGRPPPPRLPGEQEDPISPGQGRTGKGGRGRADGRAGGKRDGRGQKVFHPEKMTCSSHRRTSKRSSRTTCKVQSRFRVTEIKQVSKKRLGEIDVWVLGDGAAAKRRPIHHSNFWGNIKKLNGGNVGRMWETSHFELFGICIFSLIRIHSVLFCFFTLTEII